MELVESSNHMTVGQWREFLEQSPQANWMQSWSYARACYRRDAKRTRLFTLRHRGGPVGFFALQEIKLGPVHVWNLPRGPLWFQAEVEESWLASFASEFSSQFSDRWWRRRRWLPEWEENGKARDILSSVGFQALPQSFETLWVDLTKPLPTLRENLDQKWRNGLHKSERSSLDIEVDRRATNLEHFLKRYEFHKIQKGFQGPTSAFFQEEIQNSLQFQDAFLLWARCQGEIVAGAYFLRHGRNLSYRLGWNTERGRQLNAHYGLLWRALEVAHQLELKAFDLGGVKPIEAPGVTHFKRGLGGRPSRLLGLFR